MKKSILLLLALPFLLFSCEDALEELSSIGTFKSSITGTVEHQFDGTAAFVHAINVTDTPIGSTLGIVLSKTTDQSESIALPLYDTETGGIQPGTYNYSIGGGSEIQFTPVYTVDNVTYAFPDATKTNRIIISSVGNTQVKGEFELNLMELTTQSAVKITGTFHALGTTENN